MDLVVTRLNGKRVPARPGAGLTQAEAYSHEVISYSADAEIAGWIELISIAMTTSQMPPCISTSVAESRSR